MSRPPLMTRAEYKKHLREQDQIIEQLTADIVWMRDKITRDQKELDGARRGRRTFLEMQQRDYPNG